jgi:hypothetical protein
MAGASLSSGAEQLSRKYEVVSGSATDEEKEQHGGHSDLAEEIQLAGEDLKTHQKLGYKVKRL